jgi:hypothetical protein
VHRDHVTRRARGPKHSVRRRFGQRQHARREPREQQLRAGVVHGELGMRALRKVQPVGFLPRLDG